MDLQSPSIQSAVEKFVACIRTELHPESSPAARRDALVFCETFRTTETPFKVAEVGLVLISQAEVEVVFSGLKILEDIVKYHWATLECRNVVKHQLMSLLETNFSNLSNQPSFLKEALARTIVEIAKREWPQLWGDLIPTLFDLGKHSNLPYIILRRLFEDISMCQVEENFPRKRELLQSLVAVAKDVVPSLFQLLYYSLQCYATTKSIVDLGKCKLFLGSLLPFIELANLNLFMEENRFSLFFKLLSDPDFKCDMADCILQFFQRKSSEKKEKSRICAEIQANFDAYISAVKQADPGDQHYIRQLCDVLAFVASNCEKDPDSLLKFFTAVDCMASRSESAAVLGAASAFNNFLRCTVDSDAKGCLLEPQYSRLLTSIINLIVKKLVSSPIREEKDEMNRLKGEFCNMLRSINRVWKQMYVLLSPWIVHAVNNAESMEVSQWEALGSVIDTVSSTVSCDDEEVVALGLQHLQQCFLKFRAEENIERKSAMLSSVSGLFIFLTLARRKREMTSDITEFTCSIIKTLFQCFSYPETERNIRRHVAALFIKLAKDNGEIFVEMFSSIHQETENIKHKLSSMEYVSLIETLLITSNRWEERSQQLNFISTLILPTEWQEIANICRSPTEFATMFTEETFYLKRPLFHRNLSLLVAMFNRIQFPAESSFGSTTFAAELFNYIRPTFPVILSLIRTLHSLVLDPQLSFLVDMNAGERNSLLGFVDHLSPNDENARMKRSFNEKLQSFVRTIEDSAYVIIGGCGPKFGVRLYSIPNITDAYLSYVGTTSAQMNDFQIRRFLRMVYKPFLLACPYEYASAVVTPFIQHFGIFLMNRLVSRWASVDFDSIDDEKAPSEEAEVVENACLRLLTKEYFDVVVRLLEISNNTTEDLNKTVYESGSMDMDDEGPHNGHPRSQQASNMNEMGEIGKLIMNETICFQAIVHLSATALCWKFSQASLKASRAILLTLKYIYHYPEVVQGVFSMAVKAMVLFSTSETNFDALFRIADSILLQFYASDPQILQLLKQWGAPEKELGRLINLLQVNPTAGVKKRKEVFKSILREHPEIAKNQGPTKQWLSQLPQLFVVNTEKAGKRDAASKDMI